MNILLAEDSRTSAYFIIPHLETLGHVVTHVLDGLAAVEACKADLPDLVLMDVVMPHMDGIEATRQIKALCGERWIPLIIMTGLSSPNELICGLDAGADDYLIKPINPNVLIARINAMHRIAVVHDTLFGILDSVFNGVITINGTGVMTGFNKAAESIFGYTATETIGKNVAMLMPKHYADEHDSYLRDYLSHGTSRIIGKGGRKVSGRRKNGEIFPMDLAVTELQCEKRNVFIGVVRDISQEEAARQEIERLALHDPLTGLPNRAHINKILDALLEGAGDQVTALFFIDLDEFKPINDKLGHEAGDQALCIVAYRLLRCLNKSSFVGRLGGDEFVVILPDIGSEEAAVAEGEKIIGTISESIPIPNSSHSCLMGASIGFVLIPEDGRTRTEILSTADQAMYEAKRAGKNRIIRGGTFAQANSQQD